MSAVKELADERAARASTRKDKEVQQWEAWKAAPAHEKPQYLQPLLQAYAPTFNTKKTLWKPPRMPASVFEAHLHKHFVDALHTFDPSRAALSTHVELRLNKAKRDVVQQQNFAYIPEGQTRLISKLRAAQESLQEDLGREPTNQEVAMHLGMSQKRVNTIFSNLRKDISASKLESDAGQTRNREEEVISLMQAQPEAYFPKQLHRDVFMHTFGVGGMPKIEGTNQLAKHLGTSAPQVSRAKSFVINEVKKYL